MNRDVKFYKTIDGYCPVLDFIDSLSDKAARKVTWTLSLLEERQVIRSSLQYTNSLATITAITFAH